VQELLGKTIPNMLVNNDGSSSGGFLQLGSSLPRNSELMPPSPVLENA